MRGLLPIDTGGIVAAGSVLTMDAMQGPSWQPASLGSGAAGLFEATPAAASGGVTLRAITGTDLTGALASPPAIGSGTAAAGSFTSLSASGQLTATASTASTSTTTGAAVVTGGLGVGGAINAGGAISGAALSGTTLSLSTSQSANAFFAAPSTGSGAPAWRAIAAADLTTALASPPAIGGTTAAAGTFTAIAGTSETIKSATGGVVTLDSTAAGQQSSLVFNDNGTAKWSIDKLTGNTLQVYDKANSTQALAFDNVLQRVIVEYSGDSTSGTTGSLITQGGAFITKTLRFGGSSGTGNVIAGGAVYVATASVTIANTTTATSIIGSGVGSTTIPSNWLVAGKKLRLKAWGSYGYTGTPGIAINISIGGVQLAGMTPGVAATGSGWVLDCEIMVYSSGSSGSLYGWCMSIFGNSFVTSPQLAGTVNTTVANSLTATFAWTVANAANTISIYGFSVECAG